jgi:hypothetical protein
MTSPGETDVLLVFAAILLIGAVLALGVLFLWLHSLPERMVHNATKWQIDLVAVLCLLSLFTHVHAFWVAALLLAFVKVPDFGLPDVSSPLGRIAGSLEQLANGPMSASTAAPTEDASVSTAPAAVAKPVPQKPSAPTGKSND